MYCVYPEVRLGKVSTFLVVSSQYLLTLVTFGYKQQNKETSKMIKIKQIILSQLRQTTEMKSKFPFYQQE